MVNLASDNTDEDANLAKVRTEAVHLDEDKVLEEVLAEDVNADEEMDLVTRIFHNLGQVMTHLGTIHVIGLRAARAVARDVLRQAPEGPTAEVAVDMTEYVHLEDLTNGKTVSYAKILDWVFDESTEVSHAEYADVVVEYLNFNLNLNLNLASRWARRRFP